MIGWVLLAIAIGLLLVGLVRERFEANESIRAPPYDKKEKTRMYDMLQTKNQAMLMDKAKKEAPGADPAKLKEMAGGYISPTVEAFFTTVFKPATTPITKKDVDDFLKGRSSDLKPAEKDILTTYFVGQSGVGTSVKSGYADVLTNMGQNPGYLISNAPATDGTAGPTGTGPSSTATGGTGPAATVGGSTTTGRTAGGTTGGSSVNSPAPNAGGGGKGRQVFGPVFTSLGAPINTDGNSTRTNQYPELLGGMGDTSVRTASGIQNPSQNWLLSQSGALPSTGSLGSDPNSMYLPYSRVPGDQDLIPDPYRLSRNYSTSSYSSKTDPVPFLTDFSAFSK